MYIVNKSKTQISNLNHVTSLYIGTDNTSIKVDFINGKGCQAAKYKSHEEAVTALEMLGRAIDLGRSEAFFFPDGKELQAKIQKGEQKAHHISGKKPKGHGGS